MTPTSNKLKETHFIVASIPFYGHARPLFSLTLNLLATFDNLHITFLTTVPFYPKLQAEVVSHSPTKEVLARLRIVAVHSPPATDNPNVVSKKAADDENIKDLSMVGEDLGTQLAIFAQNLTAVVKAIWAGEPVYEEARDTHLPGLALKPVLAICDAFMPFWNKIVGEALPAGASIPDIGFFPTSAACFVQHFGKLEQNGLMARVMDGLPKLQAERPNADEGSLMHELYHRTRGQLQEWPAHPPMYDYEFLPQTEASPMPEQPIMSLAGALATFRRSAGVITTVCPDFEPGAASAAETVFDVDAAGGFSKKVFQVGPQFSANQWDRTLHTLTDAERPVIDFCDKTLKEHGEKSLLYISFGSIFWPAARPDVITTLVNVLTAARKPFLLAGGSPACVFEEGLKDKIAQDGIGMVGGFIPQFHVLSHPATGWFLTHGGSNSLAESLLFKVPLIVWPMGGDQPMNAALVEKLGNGVELLQVRTGLNVGKKIARSGIVVEGTQAAMEAELKATVEMINGSERANIIRARTEELSDIQRKSAIEGLGRDELLAFAQFMT